MHNRKQEGDKMTYLPALIRTHSDIPIRASGKPGIHASAESGVTLLAVFATPVGDVEGHNYAVAFFEERDALTDFSDYTHVFVAEDEAAAALGGCAAFVHVQVGAADG